MKYLVKIGMAIMSIAQKLVKVRFIITRMTGNPNFPAPSPSLATLATAANGLEAAALKAKTGGPDDTAAMHRKEDAMDILVRQLATHIEGIANQNATTAAEVILSAGFDVKGKSIRKVLPFGAMVTGIPGEIRVQHQGEVNCVFHFQMCTDPSKEENWITISETTRARYVVTGLAPGKWYYFRARVLSKDDPTPWTEPVRVYLVA